MGSGHGHYCPESLCSASVFEKIDTGKEIRPQHKNKTSLKSKPGENILFSPGQFHAAILNDSRPVSLLNNTRAADTCSGCSAGLGNKIIHSLVHYYCLAHNVFVGIVTPNTPLVGFKTHGGIAISPLW